MNLEQFKESLSNDSPPDNISDELKALWYDGKNNWDAAHKTVQNLQTSNAAWVHAYLHRKDGDGGNADYWYRQAGKEYSNLSPTNEWEEIVYFLLSE